MTPDWAAQAEPVPYAKLDNPQSLNLYTYVLNNPVTSVDPDGHYNTGCKGSDISKCSKDIQNFEANRQRDLHSKDAGVRAAAAAYGGFNDGNNVDLKFNENSSVGSTQQETKNGKLTGRIQVTLPGMKPVGASSVGIVAHEGIHVGDMQTVFNGGPAVTRWQSELRAYAAQAAVINDFRLPTDAMLTTVAGKSSRLLLLAPVGPPFEQANERSIEEFLSSDSLYHLTQENQGGPIAFQP